MLLDIFMVIVFVLTLHIKILLYGSYHSDMLILYGEYYVLFWGYPAVIIFFIFSYIFKKLYLSVNSKDAFLFYLYRAVILTVFWAWLNGFGMDWMMLELIGIIITCGLFKNFYKMRRRKLKTCL